MTSNLLIHGDNLPVLEALQATHAARVQCVWIDPPYNTGQNLRGQGGGADYQDRFAHDTWLDDLRARLVLLRQLLHPSGSLFLQLDDTMLDYARVTLDAVFGRQVPWPTADAVTRERLQSWTPAGRGHWAVERLDNVFALYRRSALLDHPLPSVPIGEDLHWRQGRRIGYVPGAVVVHSHPRRARELYLRTRDLHLQHQLLGEPPLVPSLASLVGALPGLVRPVIQNGPAELKCQLAELWGQYRATRLAQRS